MFDILMDSTNVNRGCANEYCGCRINTFDFRALCGFDIEACRAIEIESILVNKSRSMDDIATV